MTMLLVSACQSSGRYSQRHDSAPRYVPHSIATQDAIPHYEPYRAWNSRPYTVLGKHYTPLTTGKGFQQSGIASWYGQKFHGHLTSNGETYDMYAMTAAHTTLPLPSFVRVTNQINGKQVIVRVNDRGPFHDNRVIDLSYAAAKKLDYLKTGTAPVLLEVIHIDEQNRVTVGNNPTISYAEYAGLAIPEPVAPPTTANAEESTREEIFIQVAALSDKQRVQQLSSDLFELYQVPTGADERDNVYRLRLGPIANEHLAELLLRELQSNGYPSAFTVTAP
nr:septal ring lytic transglycosylase RlpA family protein [Alteromonas oceanisediminis]